MTLLGPQEILLIFVILIILAVFVIGIIVIVWSILQFLKGKREGELEARVKELEKRLNEREQKQ